jgi:hypothetical protein
MMGDSSLRHRPAHALRLIAVSTCGFGVLRACSGAYVSVRELAGVLPELGIRLGYIRDGTTRGLLRVVVQSVKRPAAEVSYRVARRAASFQASLQLQLHIPTPRSVAPQHHISKLGIEAQHQDDFTIMVCRSDGLLCLHTFRRDPGPAAVRLPLGASKTSHATALTNTHRAN